MNLLEIRTEFVKVSGRYDLVTSPTDFSDNGADFYLKEGQKALERRINVGPTRAKFFKDLAAGDWLVQINSARAIWEVWVMTSTARTQLKQLTEVELRSYSDTVPISQETPALPTHYYPTNLRRSPEDPDPDSTLVTSYLDVVSQGDLDELSYKGIAIYPPADQAYGLEIQGLFYNAFPGADSDENYWSENYPTLMIMSSLQQLEYMYKGSKTVSAWDKIIENELIGIEKDQIEQEIANVTQMEG